MPDPQQVMERLRKAVRHLDGTMPTMVGAWLSGTDIPEALRDALTALIEAQEREKELLQENARITAARYPPKYEDCGHFTTFYLSVNGWQMVSCKECELSRLRAENETLRRTLDNRGPR